MTVVQDPQWQDTRHLSENFETQLERSLETCDLLEALADELPRRSVAVWRAAKVQCQDVLRDHLALGAEQILPCLRLRAQGSVDLGNLLLHFEREYKALAHRLDDLDDLLFDAVATDRNRIGPEALGYALRSHFDTLRKHIGWERDVLLPMVTRNLTVQRPSRT